MNKKHGAWSKNEKIFLFSYYNDSKNGLAIGKSAISKCAFLYNIALSREKTACRLRTARSMCRTFSIRKNPFHNGP